jgi:formylglycine-generating enzyme required for sulfatase activity
MATNPIEVSDRIRWSETTEPMESVRPAGNVWQWTSDWFADQFSGDSVDPTGPTSGQTRTLRGGSWSNNPGVVHVSVRDWSTPGG